MFVHFFPCPSFNLYFLLLLLFSKSCHTFISYPMGVLMPYAGPSFRNDAPHDSQFPATVAFIMVKRPQCLRHDAMSPWLFLRHDAVSPWLFLRHNDVLSLLFLRHGAVSAWLFLRHDTVSSWLFLRHDAVFAELFVRHYAVIMIISETWCCVIMIIISETWCCVAV